MKTEYCKTESEIETFLDKYIKETNQEDFVVNINDYALSSEVNLNNNSFPNINKV